MKITAQQVKTVKVVCRDQLDEILDDEQATGCVRDILNNTESYYQCGDRDESTRTDDFYHDAKEYFAN